MIYTILAAFWIMQATAVFFFKLGGTAPPRWIPCFVAGNVVGVTSTWLWMHMMKIMNPNVASGLAIGGGFLAGQIVLYLVFKGHLSALQVIGILAILSGMVLLCVGGKT